MSIRLCRTTVVLGVYIVLLFTVACGAKTGAAPATAGAAKSPPPTAREYPPAIPLDLTLQEARAQADANEPVQIYIAGGDENRRTIESSSMPLGISSMSVVAPRPVRLIVDGRDYSAAIIKRGAAAGEPGQPEYIFYYLNDPNKPQTIELRW